MKRSQLALSVTKADFSTKYATQFRFWWVNTTQILKYSDNRYKFTFTFKFLQIIAHNKKLVLQHLYLYFFLSPLIAQLYSISCCQCPNKSVHHSNIIAPSNVQMCPIITNPAIIAQKPNHGIVNRTVKPPKIHHKLNLPPLSSCLKMVKTFPQKNFKVQLALQIISFQCGSPNGFNGY